MKNFIQPSVVFAILIFAASAQSQKLDDRWLDGVTGYERAAQIQRELNVPLVVYFQTDWCPFCRSLESQYLTSAPVQNYLKGVVKVRINAEQGSAEKDLATRFGVTGYPSFFIIRNASSLPMRVHPFRRGAPNLTPSEFARACREPGLWSIGPLQMSPVRVSITPISPRVAPQVQLVSATIPATVSNPALPTTLNSILDRYVTALGGRDAVVKLKSRVTRSRVDVAGNPGGRLETFAKAPNRLVTVMNTKSTGTVKRGFDGQTSWMISNQKGFQHPTAVELAALAAEADFYRELKLTELYSRITLVGTGTVGTREAHIVEATPRIGAVERLYFDVETGLLIRRDAMGTGSNGVVRAEFYFSDWREVDGVKIPFKTTEQTPNATYVFTVEEVKHNVALDEGIFRQP